MVCRPVSVARPIVSKNWRSIWKDEMRVRAVRPGGGGGASPFATSPPPILKSIKSNGIMDEFGKISTHRSTSSFFQQSSCQTFRVFVTVEEKTHSPGRSPMATAQWPWLPPVSKMEKSGRIDNQPQEKMA